MKTSESVLSIIPALLTVQRAVSGTIKDKVGKVQMKSGGIYEYNYSDLSSVLDECKGPLNEAGILLLQTPSADNAGVTVTTTLMHESGEWVQDALYMPVVQGTPQAYGSAITYARRYGLQSMMGLKAEDDGGEAASKAPAKAAVQRKDSARQATVDAFDELSADTKDLMRSHASEVIALHTTRGDIVTYLTEQHFDQEGKLALWSLLPSNVRSWIKDQEQIARMNAAARSMKTTELASQA